MKLTTDEIQALWDIIPVLEEKRKETEDKIRESKWLVNVPQHGDEYVKNKNVWELQDAAIKRINQEFEFTRNTILKITRDSK